MSEKVKKQYRMGVLPKGDYSDSVMYDVNDWVNGADGQYASKRSGNIGHPLSDKEWWVKVVDLAKLNNAVKAATDATSAAVETNTEIRNAERDRVSAEQTRVSKEQERVAAETQRVLDEDNRKDAEAERQRVFTRHEAERAATFVQKESEREEAFTQNEAGRTNTFNQHEVERDRKVDEAIAKFPVDAPKNGKKYGRKDGEWSEIKEGSDTPIDTELNPETADNEHAAGAKITADKLTELEENVGVLMADHTLEEILGEETTEEDVEELLDTILGEELPPPPPIPENAIFKGDPRIDAVGSSVGMQGQAGIEFHTETDIPNCVRDMFPSGCDLLVKTNYYPNGEPNADTTYLWDSISAIYLNHPVSEETFEWISIEQI